MSTGWQIFLWGWFAISAFVMLHLILKIREIKMGYRTLIEEEGLTKTVDSWEKEYVGILSQYGSVKEFIAAHNHDFEMMRGGVVEFMLNQEKLITELIDKFCDKKTVSKENMVKILMNLVSAQDMLSTFITNETMAHDTNPDNMEAILIKMRELYQTPEILKFVYSIKDTDKKLFDEACRLFYINTHEYDTAKKH